MGKTCLIYSIKPESPETDLSAIESEVGKIEHFNTLEIKPFMFGMEQIFATFVLPEGVGPDELETKLDQIKGVQSVTQEACTLI